MQSPTHLSAVIFFHSSSVLGGSQHQPLCPQHETSVSSRPPLSALRPHPWTWQNAEDNCREECGTQKSLSLISRIWAPLVLPASIVLQSFSRVVLYPNPAFNLIKRRVSLVGATLLWLTMEITAELCEFAVMRNPKGTHLLNKCDTSEHWKNIRYSYFYS